MSCEVCYGTSYKLGESHDESQPVEPDPDLVESMGELYAMKLAKVQARYNRYREMYTNCTTVNGNLEITHLVGPGNQTFNLDFLQNIREVTSRPSVD